MKALNNIDLGKSQIINVVIHVVTSLPTSPAAGQMVYHDGFLKYHNASTWITLNDPSLLLSNIIDGKGISKTINGQVHTLDVDVDNITITIDPSNNSGKVMLKAQGTDTSHLKDAAVTTIKVKDKNISFAKIQDMPVMTVIGNVESVPGSPAAVSVLSEVPTAIPSAHNSLASTKAIKAYVDAKIASIGTLQGSLNPGIESQFPANAKKSDYWHVVANGTVQNIRLNTGDVIIANTDNASRTDPNHWIFLESNRDQATTTILGLVTLATAAETQAGSDTHKAVTPASLAAMRSTDAETQTGTAQDRFVTPASLAARTATETRTGLAAIATHTEVNAGVNDLKFVTPLKLKTFFDAATGGHAVDIGNNSATTFTITHNLGSLDVVAELYQKTTGETVLTDILRLNNNQVSLSFAIAPSSAQYRLVIKK